MNTYIYENILTASLCRSASKLIRKNLILQKDNDPKTKPAQELTLI